MIGRVFYRPEFEDYFIVIYEDNHFLLHQIWSNTSSCRAYGWREQHIMDDLDNGDIKELL